MGYTIGDTVVHPQHGAAVVERVVTKNLGGGDVEYIELYVEPTALKIMVPASSMDQVGIRDVSTKADAEVILAILDEDVEVPSKWAERNVATTARMRSTDLTQLAMVVRDLTLHARKTGKPLSANEKGSLDKCLSLLCRELALSLNISESEMMTLLEQRTSAAVDAGVS